MILTRFWVEKTQHYVFKIVKKTIFAGSVCAEKILLCPIEGFNRFYILRRRFYSSYKKLHFSFSSCWWPQHGSSSFWTRILLFTAIFAWSVCVEKIVLNTFDGSNRLKILRRWFLLIFKKLHFSFSICWWHRHCSRSFWTCILLFPAMFMVAVWVEEKCSALVCGF